MTASIEAVLEAFQCGKYREGEQRLTEYMKERGCSDHVRGIAEHVERSFNEKSKEINALLQLDLVFAPRNAEMLPVYGGLSKANTAEFRVYSFNEDGNLKGVAHEFVVRYRLFVPTAGASPCRCHPN